MSLLKNALLNTTLQSLISNTGNALLSKNINVSTLTGTEKKKLIILKLEKLKEYVLNFTSKPKLNNHNSSHLDLEVGRHMEFLYAYTNLMAYKVVQFFHGVTYNLFAMFFIGQTYKVDEILSVDKLKLFNQSRNTAEVLLDLEIDLEVCGIGWPTDPSLSLAKHFLDIMKHYVNPTLSLFGICQNMLSFAILSKDGFRKTCNIFLLSVVIAGSFQQFLSLNIAGLVEYNLGNTIHRKIKKFVCVRENFLSVEIFRLITIFIGQWGQYIFSSTFMLITFERMVAVFLPIKLKFIVTRKVVISCIVILFIIWLPLIVYRTHCFHFYNKYFLSDFGSIDPRNHDYTCILPIFQLDYVVLIFSKIIPILCVLIGSLVIAIRIKIMLNKRRQLTSIIGRAMWSNQTTKTLVMTCLVFCLSETFLYSVSYVAVKSVQHTHIATRIHFEIISFSYLLVTCCTFFIFIASSQKMFQHLIDMTNSMRVFLLNIKGFVLQQ
ncbi:G-protein coupled receptor [Biomphalaria glabrata]|nr:putative G-protein coupled receptor [Biomphalaria glabrata]